MPRCGFAPEDWDEDEDASLPDWRRWGRRYNAAHKPSGLRIDDVDFIALRRTDVQNYSSRQNVGSYDLGSARQHEGLPGIAGRLTRQAAREFHGNSDD